MRDEFFEKILNAAENRPFITAIARNGEELETIAQILEGEGGELIVTLQSDIGPPMGSNDAETTITLPMFSEFGFASVSNDVIGVQSEGKVPLYPADDLPFHYANGEFERAIDGRNISLTDPVRAKTLTLWYEGIRAEGWDTNSDKLACTISHGDSVATEIPPHGTTDFFIAITNPTPGKYPIEWDIGDTHQGVSGTDLWRWTMTLVPRNVLEIRNAALDSSNIVSRLDLDAIHRPMPAAAIRPRSGRRNALLVAKLFDCCLLVSEALELRARWTSDMPGLVGPPRSWIRSVSWGVSVDDTEGAWIVSTSE